MILHETATKKEYVYRGKIINVRRDKVAFPNGKESTREIVEHRGAVAVAAVDEEGCIYLVRQFRYAFGEELLEIPAGKLEEGEETAHLEAAIRELREETGLTAQKVDYLGVIYPSVGMLTERIHIYLARGLTQGEMDLDEDEFLNVVTMPFDQLVEQVMDGTITDAKTVATTLKVKVLLGL